MTTRRKDDIVIERLETKVDEILKLLNGNGEIGLCAQVRINKNDITEMKGKPSNVFKIVIGLAVIINTVVAAYAIFK